MALSIFDDKSHQPDESDLIRTLGSTKTIWDAVVAHSRKVCGNIEEIWKFVGAKYGWSCRLVLKKRIIVYLIPQDKHFLIAFVFGDRAVAAIEASDISADIKREVMAAKKYAEGRGIRYPVTAKKQLADIKKLIEIKQAF